LLLYNNLVVGEKSDLFHIGYFRDSPAEPPVFVASNCAAEGPRIVPLAENIFGAVYQHLMKVSRKLLLVNVF
jgi:hypothetical protein